MMMMMIMVVSAFDIMTMITSSSELVRDRHRAQLKVPKMPARPAAWTQNEWYKSSDITLIYPRFRTTLAIWSPEPKRNDNA
jgi:hypothetical protein